jgi:hypothetical protein
MGLSLLFLTWSVFETSIGQDWTPISPRHD